MAASFADLAARWAAPEAELDTAAFAHAAAGLGDVLSAVGGRGFHFAASDYNAKVASLRAAAQQPELRTLAAIVAADTAAGTVQRQGSAARSLWRVLNAMRFCRELFQGLLPLAGGAEAAQLSMRSIVWTSYGA